MPHLKTKDATNKALFDSLYKNYYAMVLQMCLGYVKGNQEEAKDLTQEIFINTWNALEKFKGASSYKTWIYRITVNTCLKYIRDTKSKTAATLEVSELKSSQEPEIATNDYSSLYLAIGQLCEIDRLIIMLVLEEADYDDISEVMGISAVNLRVKIHRIKKNLKKQLKNDF
ncbi:sigma-70 family RNA polymerase sigma factor [uncultured Draconibacterium sp.]|uniref:RNA polymerase sigma factor n=1 Tax=uncultured Draconibacterium sp. TaxID=1573823 RepID=UPI003216DF49